MSGACARNDLVGANVGYVLWGVPCAALLLGAFVGPSVRMLLWTPAFAVMGGACVANAARCGRLHCFLTGPLYLLAAAGSVLAGLGVVALDWRWIGSGTLLGTVLAYALEWVRGRYLPTARSGEGYAEPRQSGD